ncbi:MAG: two-component system sensor histidine kinase CreC, partial [Pseudomonadota bacterium]
MWFLLQSAIETLNVGMRQSAESVLVDMSHLLATQIETELSREETSLSQAMNPLQTIFGNLHKRALAAQIYKVTKTSIDTHIYVTDEKGVVIYDSRGESEGEDFSVWRDVDLTLNGEYGARTSYIDQRFTEPDDPKAMYVASAIKLNDELLGVVTVSKPIDSLEEHLNAESTQLQQYAAALLLFGVATAWLLSLWFTYALGKIGRYADQLADGQQVALPLFRDSRLDSLAQSIKHMRQQLEGKEYVENYIHSLTHELKTPITSIQGAIELLDENMPLEDRRRFLNNIETSNRRMSRLVDRMLSLAKLEGLQEPIELTTFDLLAPIKRLCLERHPTLVEKQISIKVLVNDEAIDIYSNDLPEWQCQGDRTLLTQAVANLLDNAIRYSQANAPIEITLNKSDSEHA